MKRKFQKDGDCMEKLLKEVEELNYNTPDGVIRDADTIIIDAIQKNDFEITGIAQDIFNIWRNSSDKKAVEQMFFEFTDMEFKDFLEKCKDEITRWKAHFINLYNKEGSESKLYEVLTETELFDRYGYLLSKEHGRDTELLLDVLRCNGVEMQRIGQLFYFNNAKII